MGFVSFAGAGSNSRTVVTPIDCQGNCTECESCQATFEIDLEFENGVAYWEGKCPSCNHEVIYERHKE